MSENILEQTMCHLYDPDRCLEYGAVFGSHEQTERSIDALTKTLKSIGLSEDDADAVDCACTEYASCFGEESFARGFKAGARLASMLLGGISRDDMEVSA